MQINCYANNYYDLISKLLTYKLISRQAANLSIFKSMRNLYFSIFESDYFCSVTITR